MGFFGKVSKKKSKEAQEPAASFDDALAQMDRETMDLGELRDKVMTLIWHDDMQGLHDLCESQFIMAPIMIEKIIAEIAPDNHWNDVLFLVARKMLEADPEAFFMYGPALEAKRHLVKHPEGGKEVMAPFVKFS